MAELHEDLKLGAHLYRARKDGDIMNDRTRQLWLPGLVILLVGVTFFYLFQAVGFGHIFWVNRTDRWVLGISIPALFGLPLLGAAAAYWSRTQGAGRAIQTATGLFPFALVIAALFAKPQPLLLPPLPVRFASHNFGPFGVSGHFSALAWTLVTWACIPITALLVGVLPVVLQQSSAPPRAVNHE